MTGPGLVLYRKWRPQRFSEVVGQEPVVHTLRQAVAQGRVAHAYLFCGPRGTGKTTVARILARAVNCSSPQEGEPDGSCPSCQAVAEGRALDLVEIDAASHRRVEEARDLRERVFSAGPAEGRYKVYVVDEVHMLTEAAFNTLLKTLEEPPPWALFVLCTTDPQKVPATIISRCQRFDFRRLPLQAVKGRLETICRGEGYDYEEEALALIARTAWGSLRDACNILEQVVTTYGPRVRAGEVRDLLGLAPAEEALDLVEAVLQGDMARGLTLITRAVQDGKEPRTLHRSAVDFLRALLLLKSGLPEEVDYPPEVLARLRLMASSTSLERVARALRLLAGVPEKGMESTALPLELAVVEACSPEGEPQAGPSSPPHREASPPRPAVEGPRPASPPPPPGPPAPSTLVSERPPVPAGPVRVIEDARWEDLCRRLSRTKNARFFLGPLLRDCRSRRVEGETLVLVFRSRSNMERTMQELEHPLSRKALEEALRAVLGAVYPLRLTVEENNSSPGGHLLRAALTYGARVVEEKEEP